MADTGFISIMIRTCDLERIIRYLHDSGVRKITVACLDNGLLELSYPKDYNRQWKSDIVDEDCFPDSMKSDDLPIDLEKELQKNLKRTPFPNIRSTR